MRTQAHHGHGVFTKREEEIKKRDLRECIFDLLLAFFLLSSVALIMYDIRENYVRKVDLELQEMERVKSLQTERRIDLKQERQEIEQGFKSLDR